MTEEQEKILEKFEEVLRRAQQGLPPDFDNWFLDNIDDLYA